MVIIITMVIIIVIILIIIAILLRYLGRKFYGKDQQLHPFFFLRHALNFILLVLMTFT